MTTSPQDRTYKVGEVRPSQLLLSYGVGATVDLPALSVLVMGLDEWDTRYCTEIGEERTLLAARRLLGPQVQRLLTPPMPEPDSRPQGSFFDPADLIGVPVSSFPRWMVCPYCRLLAPLSSGLFTLKGNNLRPDRIRYVHDTCKKPGAAPQVLPARFLVACPQGHLDDFPWEWFVHRGPTTCQSVLYLREFGPSGEAVDVEVSCSTCQQKRRMSDAFSGIAAEMPPCTARWPHLRRYAPDPCPDERQQRAVLLGASNLWFPATLSSLALPPAGNVLERLVADDWVTLEKATSPDVITAFRLIGKLVALHAHSAAEIWAAVQAHRRAAAAPTADDPSDLKVPEWAAFTRPTAMAQTRDFFLTPSAVPAPYADHLRQVVLAERLREVRALVGFTRIEAGGIDIQGPATPSSQWAPLARKHPAWVPAVEMRGEGIFLEFSPDSLFEWEQRPAVQEWERNFRMAHMLWRRQRHLTPLTNHYPGVTYVLLHSFSHALMRVLAVECGYPAASIKERLYARADDQPGGPMAGILISTAAPDSEGTLGGLVRLGQPAFLERLIGQMLSDATICAADPLCADHRPAHAERATLHGAACHSCLFAPETSCERGNRYLDRSVLVNLMIPTHRAYFLAP